MRKRGEMDWRKVREATIAKLEGELRGSRGEDRKRIEADLARHRAALAAMPQEEGPACDGSPRP